MADRRVLDDPWPTVMEKRMVRLKKVGHFLVGQGHPCKQPKARYRVSSIEGLQVCRHGSKRQDAHLRRRQSN
jgi:hypothetical protein